MLTIRIFLFSGYFLLLQKRDRKYPFSKPCNVTSNYKNIMEIIIKIPCSFLKKEIETKQLNFADNKYI